MKFKAAVWTVLFAAYVLGLTYVVGRFIVIDTITWIAQPTTPYVENKEVWLPKRFTLMIGPSHDLTERNRKGRFLMSSGSEQEFDDFKKLSNRFDAQDVWVVVRDDLNEIQYWAFIDNLGFFAKQKVDQRPHTGDLAPKMTLQGNNLRIDWQPAESNKTLRLIVGIVVCIGFGCFGSVILGVLGFIFLLDWWKPWLDEEWPRRWQLPPGKNPLLA